MAGRTYAGRTHAERSAERRQRLLRAGTTLIARDGARATTITAVAREAGITARHFYEHFASIEDLLLAVYEDVLERHRGGVTTALEHAAPGDMDEVLRVSVTGAIDAWTSDPAAATIAYVEVHGFSPRVEARRRQAIAEYCDLVDAIAGDLHARGLVEAPARPLAARALIGAMIGLVEAWLAAPDELAPADLAAEALAVARAVVLAEPVGAPPS